MSMFDSGLFGMPDKDQDEFDKVKDYYKGNSGNAYDPNKLPEQMFKASQGVKRNYDWAAQGVGALANLYDDQSQLDKYEQIANRYDQIPLTPLANQYAAAQQGFADLGNMFLDPSQTQKLEEAAKGFDFDPDRYRKMAQYNIQKNTNDLAQQTIGKLVGAGQLNSTAGQNYFAGTQAKYLTPALTALEDKIRQYQQESARNKFAATKDVIGLENDQKSRYADMLSKSLGIGIEGAKTLIGLATDLDTKRLGAQGELIDMTNRQKESYANLVREALGLSVEGSKNLLEDLGKVMNGEIQWDTFLSLYGKPGDYTGGASSFPTGKDYTSMIADLDAFRKGVAEDTWRDWPGLNGYKVKYKTLPGGDILYTYTVGGKTYQTQIPQGATEEQTARLLWGWGDDNIKKQWADKYGWQFTSQPTDNGDQGQQEGTSGTGGTQTPQNKYDLHKGQHWDADRKAWIEDGYPTSVWDYNHLKDNMDYDQFVNDVRYAFSDKFPVGQTYKGNGYSVTKKKYRNGTLNLEFKDSNGNTALIVPISGSGSFDTPEKVADLLLREAAYNKDTNSLDKNLYDEYAGKYSTLGKPTITEDPQGWLDWSIQHHKGIKRVTPVTSPDAIGYGQTIIDFNDGSRESIPTSIASKLSLTPGSTPPSSNSPTSPPAGGGAPAPQMGSNFYDMYADMADFSTNVPDGQKVEWPAPGYQTWHQKQGDNMVYYMKDPSGQVKSVVLSPDMGDQEIVQRVWEWGGPEAQKVWSQKYGW